MSEKRPRENRMNPNAKLKELLKKRKTARKMKNLTPEQETDLFNEIAEELAMRAQLTAVVDPADRGAGLFESGSSLRFACLEVGVSRQRAIPFFTGADEIMKWQLANSPSIHTVNLSFDDIYSFIAQDHSPLLIDPFGDEMLLSFDLVEQIKQKKDLMLSSRQEISSRVVQEPTMVKLGDPKERPEKMIKALREAAAKVPAIRSLWLKEMISGSEKSILVTIDAEGRGDQYYQVLGDASYKYMPWGYALDFVTTDEDLGRQIAEKYSPIYRK